MHICKDCTTKPREVIEEVDLTNEIHGFMSQSHISPKNRERLVALKVSDNPRVAELASIVLEVALAKPYKRRRLKFLAAEHRELFVKVVESGLAAGHHS